LAKTALNNQQIKYLQDRLYLVRDSKPQKFRLPKSTPPVKIAKAIATIGELNNLIEDWKRSNEEKWFKLVKQADLRKYEIEQEILFGSVDKALQMLQDFEAEEFKL